MLNVRIAADHLYGKLLFTWLSLVMSLMVSFCDVFFFPTRCLDEIWDLIKSVSEGVPTYSSPDEYRLPVQVFKCSIFEEYKLKEK